MGNFQINNNLLRMGKWTMVYDEGFEINLNRIKYFAFSKYEP
jgi:hypothetical protein